MARVRLTVGAALVVSGIVGAMACAGLIGFMLLFVPEMDGDKKLSESLQVGLIAAGCGGLVVAGRILRRE